MSFSRSSRIACLACIVAWLGAASGGLCVAQEGTEDAARQYNLAVELQNRGAYQRAVEAWSRFIAQQPSDPRLDRALHYRGICQLKLNRPAEAAQSFAAVLRDHPKSELREASRLNLGMAQYQQGQQGQAEMYDHAAKTFADVLSRSPPEKSIPQALFYLAECQYQRGHKAEAIGQYSRLLAKYPQSGLAADALYALAVAQQEVNRPAEADKSLAEFLRRFPENQLATEVRMRRGDVRFTLGDYEVAAQMLGEAATKPGFEMADYAALRQAAAVAELKRYAEAARLYAAVAERFPRSPYAAEARLAAGKNYFQAGDLAASQAALKRAAADSAHALDAAHWTARILLQQKKAAQALAVAEKAIAGNASGPMVAQLLLDQADALYELPGRRLEAASRYAAVATKYPQESVAPQALYTASATALAERDYRLAREHAEQFLKRYPTSDLAVDATYVAAESDLQLGKTAEAAERYGQLLKRWPSHADAESWAVRRGLALFLAKDYRGAVAVLTPVADRLTAGELRAEALYVVGNSELELGHADEAQRRLSAAVAAAPRWRLADETLLGLALAQRQQNQLAAAQATLRRLIAEFPQSGTLERAYYRLGEYAYAANDSRQAAEAYAQVAKRWPKSPLVPHALHGLAWTRLAQGDTAGAAEAAAQLTKQYPDDKLAVRARYAQGLARQQLGQYALAIEDFKAFLAAAPGNDRADARYALALCQVGLKQWAEAVASLERLLIDDPQYAAADKVLYELAWAEKSQGRAAQAAAAFRRLAERCPTSPLTPESLYHAGEHDYQQGRFGAAGRAYHAALEKAGQTALGEKAAHKLGWAYWRMHDFENARSSFYYQRKTWPHGPLAADATFLEAECLRELKRYDEALKVYAEVKNPSGKDSVLLTLVHAGQAAGQLGRWAESLEWLDRAAKQFPQSALMPEILCEQGWAKQHLDQWDEAVRLYQQVVAKSDREVAARAQFLIGQAHVHHGRHAEAIKSFYTVAYGYSFPRWQADAMYAAGQSLETLKNTSQAVKQYRELVERFPESEKAAAARERIKLLAR
jgi:TolA-binding protein